MPTISAPAKINVYLRVFPPTNGFHPLRSWFRTVDLFDTLSLETIDGDSAECRVHCDDPSVPVGEENLVCRAHAALAARLPPVKAARYELTKRIPIGGGLGGGSSDAAAVLAIQHDLKRQPTRNAKQTLFDIATGLGSDVPFFLHHQLAKNTHATCTGRGEIVEPFEPRRTHAVLLILPGLHVATPSVFTGFDRLPAPADDGDPDFAAWSALPTLELLPKLRNDLESATFRMHPTLGDLRSQCERCLGRPVRMTGSGSTLFTLYDDHAEAADVTGMLDVRAIVA